MFATDYAIRPGPIWLGRRKGRGLRIALAARAYSHPGKSAQPLAGRRRSPKSMAQSRSVVALDRRCCSHNQPASASGICLVVERDQSPPPRKWRAFDFLQAGDSCLGLAEMERRRDGEHGTPFKKTAGAARAGACNEEIWTKDEADITANS